MTRERQDVPEFLLDALVESSEPELSAAAENLVGLSSALTATAGSLDSTRSRLLAAIAAPAERYAPLYGKLVALFDLPVSALRAIFERAAEPAEWQAGPLPTASLLHFAGGPRVASADTGLVRLKAGSRFPLHRHQAPERVLIVDGSYEDDAGRVYRPGDLHVMDTGSQHRLHVSASGAVLLAVVLEAEIVVLEAP